MNYIFIPSLEHIALAKVAITLWNLPDIRILMAKFCFPMHPGENQKKWLEVEERVIEKVHMLPQPRYLQENVLGLIKPIGLQILKWIEFHCKNFLGVNLPSEFCWTSQGTINNKKSVNMLINDEQMDITERYNLACIYCLEQDILKLWNKMPENRKNFFYSEPDLIHVVQQELVAFWTDEITGETTARDSSIERRLGNGSSPAQYIFETSANSGNKAAVEYFFQKLSTSEKEECLVRTAGCVAKRRDHYRISTDFSCEHYADVLCFLLSHMNEDQQIDLFESHFYYVLRCLLDWPWQSFFLKTANRMWNFLPNNAYNHLLKMIVSKIMAGYKDFNYQSLSEEFWRQSPSTLKRCFTDDTRSFANILYRLLQIKDGKNIKAIIRNASLTAKNKLIFSKRGRYMFDEMIYCEEWDLLELFVQECIQSEDEMLQFKAEFKEHIALRYSRNELPKNKKKWDKFFHFLDDLEHRGEDKYPKGNYNSADS